MIYTETQKNMRRSLLIIFLLVASTAFAQNYNFLNGPYGGGADKIIAAGSGRLLAYKVGVGVFKSDDAGATWVKSSSGLATPYIVDLFMDSGGKVYALYDASIYSSADNGNTWTLLANTGFSSAARMAQGPSGNLFIASQYSINKVYRSTNGGTSWFERLQFLPSGFCNVTDFEFTAAGRML